MTHPEPATSPHAATGATAVGSVFVSNYPPFSFWSGEAVAEFHRVLAQPPRPAVPLGLYLHIPFCRRRCKFCYFKVFTDKNAAEIGTYVDTLVHELAMYRDRPAIAGRPLHFIYFGGGTPSYISVKHLHQLVAGIREHLTWEQPAEVAFECEPGTLTRSKLEAIREIGVTRLSLGVENFSDHVLSENGRAHVSEEIYRVLPWIRELGFAQLNIDLIAGMVGETWESWRDTVARTLEVAPESVTIYQMELPYNTVYSQRLLGKDEGEAPLVADWQLKRAWHDYAIEQLAAGGYEVSSAYTMVRRDLVEKAGGNAFVYRDQLWQGSDLLSAGVSSFGHLSGVHYQNHSQWTPYLDTVAAGQLPVARAYVTSTHERLTRELILQLKRGRLDRQPFLDKFGVDVLREYQPVWQELEDRRMLEVTDGTVTLTRDGLLQVDHLLPAFYEPRCRDARYT